MENQNNNPNKRHHQDKKKNQAKKLYSILYNRPISRRMAATQLGFTDQTYMVTQIIIDWLAQGKAAVVGKVKCSRSNQYVEAVSTNPNLFPKSNQLKMF